MNLDDKYFMKRAIFLAKQAYQKKEVPVGALIVKDNKIIAEAYNQTEILKDSTAHAEMLVLTAAQSYLENQRLFDCTLYVSLEPCMMCSGAIILSRISRIVYAAKDLRLGFLESNYNPVKELNYYKNVSITSGVLEEESSFLLKDFFKTIRANNKN